MAIPIKSSRDLDAMRAAGALLWRILDQAVHLVAPGLTTLRIDEAIADLIRSAGAEPLAPEAGFLGVCSVCINEEAVHAPPGPRIVRAGDVVTIDAALRLNGWCADAARTLVVAPATPESTRLAAAALSAANAAIAAVRPGARWSNVAAAAQAEALRAGCFLVPTLSGHGIGRRLHEPPACPFGAPGGGNRGASGQDFVLRPGMVLTIEPVLALGAPEVLGLDDGWTMATADRASAAHEERTVAVTRHGAVVLTAPE